MEPTAPPTSTGPPITTQNGKTIYFAYGSNLSLTQMTARCPGSTYIGLAKLDGYKWIIGERGYANVISSPAAQNSFKLRGKPLPPSDTAVSDHVIGMLYTLTEEDEQNLDWAEGVPDCYVKEWHAVEVLTEGVEVPQQVLVYVDRTRTGEGVCREEYVARINRGVVDAKRVGMGEGYVERYIRPFVRREEVPEVVRDPFSPGE